MLLGSKKLMKKALRKRKQLGGGMRQIGILAGAIDYALENNLKRMRDDHNNAKYFAEEVNKINGLNIKLKNVQSNIVIIELDKNNASTVVERLEKLGLLSLDLTTSIIRVVFHIHISNEDVQRSIEIFQKVELN